MPTIGTDAELRALLNRLPPVAQRIIGLRFARSVAHLCREARVQRAIDTGLDPQASPEQLEDAFRAARSHATKTYTDCGKDTDWLAQADHFVARATAAALTPEAQRTDKANPAWKAAMHARMANNCELVESDDDTHGDEVRRQYAIADEFLAQAG